MNSSAIQRINNIFQQSLSLHEQSLEALTKNLVDAGEILTRGLLDGGKIMTCGNGESVLEATSFSTTLINIFEKERPGLPTVSLAVNFSILTAVSRDYHIDQIYSRQIHALANQEDVLAVFTTDGQSPEISKAIDAAHQYSVPVVLFSGGDGGQAAKLLEDNDCELRVPARLGHHIREIHLLLIHCLCDYIDNTLFNN